MRELCLPMGLDTDDLVAVFKGPPALHRFPGVAQVLDITLFADGFLADR